MNGTFQMVKLDLISMKPYLKSYLPFLGIVVLITIVNVGVFFTTLVVALTLLMMSGNIFSVQEKNHLDRLYNTLPIDERAVVLGRYIYIFLYSLLAAVVGYAAAAIPVLLNGIVLNKAELFFGTLISISTMCVLSSIQLPLYYRFGHTKAQLAVIAPFIVISLGIPALVSIIPEAELWMLDFLNFAQSNMLPLAVGGFALSLLLFTGSYYISLRVRRRNVQG